MKQITRLIELNEDYNTATNFALDIRNPKTGMHAQAVESGVNTECWNVRLVINLHDGELGKDISEYDCDRCSKYTGDGDGNYIEPDDRVCEDCFTVYKYKRHRRLKGC
jgi:hypothetical protein